MQKKSKETAQEVKDLVLAIRSGCIESKETLAKLLFPVVRNIVSKYYKDPDDRVSTTGYIIGKVFKKMDYLDLNKSVLSYIKFMANNHCIDEYRRNFRKKRVLIYDNEYLDQFESVEIDNSLTKTDYLDLYNVVTDGDLEQASILYSLMQEKMPPEEVALSYKLTVEEVIKIQKYYGEIKTKALLKKIEKSFS